MATFVISKKLSGHYKYELNTRRGKTIFISNAFELRFECEDEIELLKKSIDKLFFMRFRSPAGKFYFKILLNDKELAVSRKYSTQLMLEKGINEILKYGAKAEYLDFSKSEDIFPPAEDVFGWNLKNVLLHLVFKNSHNETITFHSHFSFSFFL